jgi:hypothetical protein
VFNSEALVGPPDYEVTGICRLGLTVLVSVCYAGESSCPFCSSKDLKQRASPYRSWTDC